MPVHRDSPPLPRARGHHSSLSPSVTTLRLQPEESQRSSSCDRPVRPGRTSARSAVLSLCQNVLPLSWKPCSSCGLHRVGAAARWGPGSWSGRPPQCHPSAQVPEGVLQGGSPSGRTDSPCGLVLPPWALGLWDLSGGEGTAGPAQANGRPEPEAEVEGTAAPGVCPSSNPPPTGVLTL